MLSHATLIYCGNPPGSSCSCDRDRNILLWQVGKEEYLKIELDRWGIALKNKNKKTLQNELPTSGLQRIRMPCLKNLLKGFYDKTVSKHYNIFTPQAMLEVTHKSSTDLPGALPISPFLLTHDALSICTAKPTIQTHIDPISIVVAIRQLLACSPRGTNTNIWRLTMNQCIITFEDKRQCSSRNCHMEKTLKRKHHCMVLSNLPVGPSTKHGGFESQNRGVLWNMCTFHHVMISIHDPVCEWPCIIFTIHSDTS